MGIKFWRRTVTVDASFMKILSWIEGKKKKMF